jgi:hypothetical protein
MSDPFGFLRVIFASATAGAADNLIAQLWMQAAYYIRWGIE